MKSCLARALAALPLLLTCASAARALTPEALSQLLPKGSQVGLVVQAVDGTPRWQQQADTLMLPASTLKLFTATAAWLALGPEFRFETRLSGQIKGSTVSALSLHLSGDPTLDRDTLKSLFGQLQQAGVRRIDGPIHLVGTFHGYHRAPGWPWDDLGICFATSVSPYLLDKGCARVPVKAKGEIPYVAVPTALPLTVTSDLMAGVPSDWCPLEMDRLGQNRYHLRGCAKAPSTLQIAIDDQKGYLEAQITRLLSGMTLRFNGEFVDTAAQGATLATHQSAPLPELLRPLLLDSNNQVADALFRSLSLNDPLLPGSFRASGRVMKRILQKELGVDLSYAEIADGSGLSRYNLVTPAQLAGLLSHWQGDERLIPLKAYLPVSGISGTLRHRQGLSGVKGMIRAKTGTFGQVSNLAGLVTAEDGSEWVVVQMINGLADRPDKKQKVADFEEVMYSCIVKQCL